MPVAQLLVYRRELPKLRARQRLAHIEDLLAASPYVGRDTCEAILDRLEFDADYAPLPKPTRGPAELTAIGIGAKRVPASPVPAPAPVELVPASGGV